MILAKLKWNTKLVEVDVHDGCHKIYGYELRKLDLSHGFCIEIDEI